LKKSAAFVGDTMFNILPNTVFPPFANDPETLKRSWYKILESEASIFFPGHGKSFDAAKLKRSIEQLKS
jgi:glyoxylase-like metal-dependent hydrolase (beta-lactamase superfamily II)